jgi:hypothetical protein
MSGASSGRSWFRYGCFSCLGLLAVILVLVGLAFLAAFLGVRNEDVVDGPSGELTAGAARAAGVPGAPGTLTADFSHGSFSVVAAGAGEAAGVEARYDRKRYELTESFEPDGRGGWEYEVRFAGRGNKLLGLLQQVLGGTEPEVTLRVPVDGPVDLDVKVRSGDLRVELERMWLREARFDASWAGMELQCSEPLEHPADSLEFRVDMAGMALEQLGNAGPSRLLVDISKGGGAVDLSGAWTRDAHVGITGRMAGIAVTLPDNVRVEGAGQGLGAPRDTEIPLPTLYIDANVVDGEVEFVD